MVLYMYVLLQYASIYECFRLLLHFMGWLVSLFLVCYSGQQLIDEVMLYSYCSFFPGTRHRIYVHMCILQSFSICDTIYDTNWPDADVSVQRYVLLILLRSQQPLTLSAGAFGTPSLAMFLNVSRICVIDE